MSSLSTGRNQTVPPPETVRQARRWRQVANRYMRAGLCYLCANQAAWGHQRGAGWKTIYVPCTECIAIIARFPLATSSPLWRRIRLTPATRRDEAKVIPMPELSAGTDSRMNMPESVAS